MKVSRDFEATVEYDGDEFCVVLRWEEDIGFDHRPHREEHRVWVDEEDLPNDVVRDLKDQFTDRYGNDADEEDHEE